MTMKAKRTMRQRKLRKLLDRFDVDDSMPEIHWERFPETRGEPMWNYACYYSWSADTIYMNEDFTVFREAEAHWSMKYPSLEKDEIRKVIHGVYQEQMQVRITMIQSLADDMGLTDTDLERMLHPVALTFCCMGIQPEDPLIATKLGGLFG